MNRCLYFLHSFPIWIKCVVEDVHKNCTVTEKFVKIGGMKAALTKSETWHIVGRVYLR